MLRLAIWYENRLGRNDGNPLYVMASLKRMMEADLLEVDHLIPDGDVKPFGKYDAHIWVDWGEDALTGILPYKPFIPTGAPLIYWASDTHLGYDHRFEMAKKSDLVFCAQKDAVARMKHDGVEAPVFWLPHAVEPYAYCDPATALHFQNKFTFQKPPQPYRFIAKKYDVCFVGHINSENRADALNRLFAEFPNFFYGQRLFNEAAEKFCQSKIVFNISMKNELNMRVFETLGSGSFLLTDRCNTIEELFQDGKHLVLYDDLDDMVKKAHYYLEHDEEREAIAKAGYEEVMKNHTIDTRVNRMLEELKKLVPQEV